MVGDRPVAVRGQHLQLDAHRQLGRRLRNGIAVFNYNLVSVVVMVFFAWFFLPFYIKSGIFTMPEFLGRRFDQRSRYYFSFICIVGNVFLDAAGRSTRRR